MVVTSGQANPLLVSRQGPQRSHRSSQSLLGRNLMFISGIKKKLKKKKKKPGPISAQGLLTFLQSGRPQGPFVDVTEIHRLLEQAPEESYLLPSRVGNRGPSGRPPWRLAAEPRLGSRAADFTHSSLLSSPAALMAQLSWTWGRGRDREKGTVPGRRGWVAEVSGTQARDKRVRSFIHSLTHSLSRCLWAPSMHRDCARR